MAPLDERIQHHLSEPAGGSIRVVDLADHRLTAAAVEGACDRLAESAPGLRLSARQVARVTDLVAGHPLALGYVCNSLTDLLGDQQVPARGDATQVPVVSAEAIDAALERCVRYSGNVADDYAVYLADVDDSDALRELLGDLARLRSPLDMRWVLTWANPVAARGLRRVRHYASLLLADGVDIRTLAEYLGHTDPGFTLGTYCHLVPGSPDKMRRAIDRAFSESPDCPGLPRRAKMAADLRR
jgi:hypothetical protein